MTSAIAGIEENSALSPQTGYVVLIASAAPLGGFLFGFHTALIRGAVLAVQKTFGASALQIGLVVSLALPVSANLYVFFFCCSWGPVVWELLGEMLPNRLCPVFNFLCFCICKRGQGPGAGRYAAVE